MSVIHKPIVGANAWRNVLFMVISFAASVVVTRVYLEATGYPQIGNETFHFAHALWGGLLQTIAALLLLIFVNRWVYSLSAVLAGIGVGLFIDEVGKFITQQNDYFFPLAAPIIYIVFLLTLLIYLVVRRRPYTDVRTDMYDVLHELEEVLEDDLSVSEHASLLTRLQRVTAQTERHDLAELATHISAFLQSDAVTIVPDRITWGARLMRTLQQIEEQYFSQQRVRTILVALFVIDGFFTLLVLAVLTALVTNPDILHSGFMQLILDEPNITSATSLTWYLVMILLNMLTGILISIGALAFLMRRDSTAIALGVVSLVITLTFVNTLSFYFDQFSILLSTMYSFSALFVLQRYRDRFLQNQPSQPLENQAILSEG